MPCKINKIAGAKHRKSVPGFLNSIRVHNPPSPNKILAQNRPPAETEGGGYLNSGDIKNQRGAPENILKLSPIGLYVPDGGGP